MNENGNATLRCPDSTQSIYNILFANYGTPNGSEGDYSIGTCHSNNSLSLVENACLDTYECTVSASNGFFGDPCPGIYKRLYIEYECR